MTIAVCAIAIPLSHEVLMQASAYGQVVVSAGYGGVIKVFENVGAATLLK